MLLLSVSNIPTCELPIVLEIIYFALLILDFVRVLLPIALIVLIMIDFSKCVINGDEQEQIKISKLAIKRILYTVLTFCMTYIVTLCFSILPSDYVPNFMDCIINAKAGNLDVYRERYENASILEEQESNNTIFNKVDDDSNLIFGDFRNDYVNKFENLYQYDSRWANYPVCKVGKTIKSSGCGYVAYTMIARYFGYSSITPQEIVDIACNEFGYTDSAASVYFLSSNLLNNEFKLKAEVIADDYNISDPNYGKRYFNEVYKALNSGKVLIIQQPGHYLSILGLNNDGTIVVGDSARGFESTNKYTVESFYEATKDQYGTCEEACGWTKIIAYSKKG